MPFSTEPPHTAAITRSQLSIHSKARVTLHHPRRVTIYTLLAGPYYERGAWCVSLVQEYPSLPHERIIRMVELSERYIWRAPLPELGIPDDVCGDGPLEWNSQVYTVFTNAAN